MKNEEIERIFDFIRELDKMKAIRRRNAVICEDRKENDAEHSWHMAMMVPLLAKYSDEPIDEGHTAILCLAHDLVEIYAGDTFCYDPKANLDKSQREISAADKLFSLLEEPLSSEIRALWDEFEERKTPEAKFAAAMDRLQPVLLNLANNGGTWVENGVSILQVEKRIAPIKNSSEKLHAFLTEKITEAAEKGWLVKMKTE